MGDDETTKRLMIAEELAEKYKGDSLGVVLTGSVAYAPHLHVGPDSDLDLLVISDDIRSQLPHMPFSEDQKEQLLNRFFEGYCVKEEVGGVPVSIHVLSKDSFEVVTRCFVANIRVFRKEEKEGLYSLTGFEEQTYKYKIKNVELKDVPGFRTIVPISFIHEDRYHLGVHRDKLLSAPMILHDTEGYVASLIEHLWGVVARNLVDESMRLYGSVDLERMSVRRALAKSSRFDKRAANYVDERTEAFVSRIR